MEFPKQIHLNQAPPQSEPTPQPPKSEPAQPRQPEPTPEPSQGKFDSVDGYFEDITGERISSADSIEIIAEDGTKKIEINPDSLADVVKPQITESEARKNAAMLMGMRESVQAFGLSFYVDGSIKSYQKYMYEPAALNRLIDAWAPIVQNANLTVSPWMGVAVAEVMCTGPLLAVAHSARQHMLSARRQAAENAALRKENEDLKSGKALRRDTKGAWKVDTGGYFENNEAGKYLPQPIRKIKPDFDVEGTYERLCYYNGKEFIDQVYKL